MVNWFGLLFLLPAAVMGAAAPWAPPKEENEDRQTNSSARHFTLHQFHLRSQWSK